MCDQLRFLRSETKRFQATGIVFRANQHKGFTSGMERMQIQQDIMRFQPVTQDIGNAILKISGRIVFAHIAIQVAIALPLLPLPGQRIGHGYQSQNAPFNGFCT